MHNNQLQEIMQSVGISEGPTVVRLYRDGESDQPSVVFQRDFQGCRIMLRPVNEPNTWTSAWFDDEGGLVSIEKFSCGDQTLGSSRADEFLSRILNEPLADMTREKLNLANSLDLESYQAQDQSADRSADHHQELQRSPQSAAAGFSETI